jgi:NADH:ubiquinone oxidoreductase subunit 4 (subunit M)
MFGAPKLTEFQDLKWNETFVFVVLTILILVIGLSSNCIIDFLEPSLSNYQVTLK